VEQVNTFWLIVAGLIVVVAIVLIFVVLPWLRREQGKTQQEPKGVMVLMTGNQAIAITAGIAACLFTVAIYFAWNRPGTTNMPQTAKEIGMSPQHAAMIKSLSERLEQNPNDGKGWAMLARSYAVLGQYKEALPAYEKAVNLIPNDPVLLVDYAEILAAANGKNLQGKPSEIIKSALLIDPNNVKGLNLIAIASYQAGDYAHAVSYWEKLLKLLPPGSPNANKINASIDAARKEESAGSVSPSQSMKQPAAGGEQIGVVVKLSPVLAGKVSPTDTVFVFAKAVSGPPMPIAVIRAQAKDLPQKFVLNDSMAMMPTMKLSNFKEVSLGAKISKSGSATQQSGDLRGEVASVKVGTDNVQLMIDKIVP
jgi:cytochrome c-type biogenesis protein CcmH